MPCRHGFIFSRRSSSSHFRTFRGWTRRWTRNIRLTTLQKRFVWFRTAWVHLSGICHQECHPRHTEKRYNKRQLGYNFRKRSLLRTKTKRDIFGRPAYKRFSLNKILSVINPFNKNVCSVRRFHDKELRKDMKAYKKIIVSDESIEFIKRFLSVEALRTILPVTSENVYDLIDFLESEVEVPLTQQEEAGEEIDHDAPLSAVKAIDELNWNPECIDYEDLNRRLAND